MTLAFKYDVKRKTFYNSCLISRFVEYRADSVYTFMYFFKNLEFLIVTNLHWRLK